MNTLLLMTCILTVGSAIFFPPNTFSKFGGQQTTRLCIQSVDPSRYQPKCFLCSNSVLPSVTTLCVNGTTIASNVTFIQARCLEQNCLVRGKRSISLETYSNISYDLSQLKQPSSQEGQAQQQDTTENQSRNRDLAKRPNSEGVVLVKQVDTVAGPDMLYAEWVQNFDNMNDIDKDYENLR